MKQDKVLSMLGLSAKAGNVASGEFSTEKAVKEGKAHLVIVAGDASDNTKKHFRDMCSFYEVPFMLMLIRRVSDIIIGKNFGHHWQLPTKVLPKPS
mgnify:CR=1 FL=1